MCKGQLASSHWAIGMKLQKHLAKSPTLFGMGVERFMPKSLKQSFQVLASDVEVTNQIIGYGLVSFNLADRRQPCQQRRARETLVLWNISPAKAPSPLRELPSGVLGQHIQRQFNRC